MNTKEPKNPDEVAAPSTDQMPVQSPDQTTPPTGRAALLAIYKAKNPDNQEEPDDESLFGFAHKGIGERDDLEGKYNNLNTSNEKLASAVVEYPEIAQFISMMANGEHPAFAIGYSFGDLLGKLDPASLAELQKGQEANKARFQKIKDNFSAYEKTLNDYAKANNLDDEMVEKINSAILDLAEAFNDREIPEEVIDIVAKGLSQNEDHTAELDAAKLAGKNEAIDELKGNKSKQTFMPDPTGTRSNKQVMAKPKYQPKNINIADAIKDKE